MILSNLLLLWWIMPDFHGSMNTIFDSLLVAICGWHARFAKFNKLSRSETQITVNTFGCSAIPNDEWIKHANTGYQDHDSKYRSTFVGGRLDAIIDAMRLLSVEQKNIKPRVVIAHCARESPRTCLGNKNEDNKNIYIHEIISNTISNIPSPPRRLSWNSI